VALANASHAERHPSYDGTADAGEHRSRIRCLQCSSRFRNGTPCQPSTACRPEMKTHNARSTISRLAPVILTCGVVLGHTNTLEQQSSSAVTAFAAAHPKRLTDAIRGLESAGRLAISACVATSCEINRGYRS
jgi:hypothetical protein